MTGIITQYNRQKNIVHTLGGVVILLGALYVYAVCTIVTDGIAQGEIRDQSAQLSYKVTELEFASVELKNSLTISRAEDMGLLSIQDPTFVNRRALGVAVLSSARQ